MLKTLQMPEKNASAMHTTSKMFTLQFNISKKTPIF